ALFFTDYSMGRWGSLRVGRARDRSAVGTAHSPTPLSSQSPFPRGVDLSKTYDDVMDPFVTARETSRENGLAGSVPSGGQKDFTALPGFVWVEIEATAVEEDGRLEVLGVAEPARRLLHPLDDLVDALEAG